MRNCFIVLLASAAAVPVTAVSAAAQERAPSERVYHFDLPAQNLASALLGFSRVTQLQVASSAEDLRDLRGSAVNGDMTAIAALARMTQALPVEARISGRTVTVLRRLGLTPVAEETARTSSPTMASAADNPAAPVSDSVVTGYRESLDVAIAEKKRATGSEEVILAEDIGAFPDQNLAEALQRVPGVAISRDSGEGRQISLRGLGPEFTRTELNGMEVLTNTASGLDSRSGVSRSRSFDYSVFASELFNKVVVEKSTRLSRKRAASAARSRCAPPNPSTMTTPPSSSAARRSAISTPRRSIRVWSRWPLSAGVTSARSFLPPTARPTRSSGVLATGTGRRSISAKTTSAPGSTRQRATCLSTHRVTTACGTRARRLMAHGSTAASASG